MKNFIHCDASHFHDGTAILGIVHEDRAWRIRARASNINAAELLAIVMARKLCGAGTIVSDAEVVVQRLTKRLDMCKLLRVQSTEEYARVFRVLENGEIIWQRRRSTKLATIADMLTRRALSLGSYFQLQKVGIKLHNCM